MKKNIISFLLLFFTYVSFSQKKEISIAFKNADYKNVIKYGKQILKKDSLDLDDLLGIGKSYNALNQYNNSFNYLLKLKKYNFKF